MRDQLRGRSANVVRKSATYLFLVSGESARGSKRAEEERGEEGKECIRERLLLMRPRHPVLHFVGGWWRRESERVVHFRRPSTCPSIHVASTYHCPLRQKNLDLIQRVLERAQLLQLELEVPDPVVALLDALAQARTLVPQARVVVAQAREQLVLLFRHE